MSPAVLSLTPLRSRSGLADGTWQQTLYNHPCGNATAVPGLAAHPGLPWQSPHRDAGQSLVPAPAQGAVDRAQQPACQRCQG